MSMMKKLMKYYKIKIQKRRNKLVPEAAVSRLITSFDINEANNDENANV